MRVARFTTVGLLFLALPLSAAAATGVVIGDSIGVGLSEVSGLHNYARNGIHIRGPRALEQMRAAPPSSTAYVVLGTNDAEGSIVRLDKYIDDLVALAEKKHISIVWLGPPCVRKSWDSRGRQLDAMLQARFAGTAVKYVSMRDQTLCSGKYQEPDGVHLKRAGYLHMWEKAQAAVQSGEYSVASVKKAPAEPPRKLASNDIAVTGTLGDAAPPPPALIAAANDDERHTRTVFIYPRASSQ
jgi:hypothetical protein